VELLEKCSLIITHAGLNSVLEAVWFGVPIVAIPVTDDQPGVAARIRWKGIGSAVPFKSLTVDRLCATIREVLENYDFRVRSLALGAEVRSVDGLSVATEAVRHLLGN
jgi:zeaxanthin glucosyltransferase